MLKPGDPVFDELAAHLQTVASGRYVEDPFHRLPGHSNHRVIFLTVSP